MHHLLPRWMHAYTEDDEDDDDDAVPPRGDL